MVRLFSICLIFCGLLAACRRSADHVALGYVDPLEKILPEAGLFVPLPPRADVARGETAVWQYRLKCPEKLEDLNVKVDNLKHSGMQVEIPADSVQVYFVGHVHESRIQGTPGPDILSSPSGFYPDPLLDDSSVSVEAGVNQAIWLSLPIAETFAPGRYETKVSISGRAGGRFFTTSQPLELYVYRADIDLQTFEFYNWHRPSFPYLEAQTPIEFSSLWWTYLGQLAEWMRECRQNVVLISPLQLAQYTFGSSGEVTAVDFGRFDEVVQFFQRKGVLKRIAGGHLAARTAGWESPFGWLIPVADAEGIRFECVDEQDTRAQAFYQKFLPSLYDHLKDKGWDDCYVQHVADEPIDANEETYRTKAAWIRRLMPGIPLIDACLTTLAASEMDICVPQLDHLHEHWDQYKSRQQSGHETWFYTSLWPQGGYANRHIRQPLIKARLLPWIAYKYDLDGYMHWGMNFWNGPDPMLETSSIQSSGRVLPGGDAWIVYPYKKHLIGSIRLAAMRDGIADYELLKELETLDSVAARRLVDRMVFGFQRYDTDVAHFRQIRKELLETLDSLSASRRSAVGNVVPDKS